MINMFRKTEVDTSGYLQNTASLGRRKKKISTSLNSGYSSAKVLVKAYPINQPMKITDFKALKHVCNSALVALSYLNSARLASLSSPRDGVCGISRSFSVGLSLRHNNTSVTLLSEQVEPSSVMAL